MLTLVENLGNHMKIREFCHYSLENSCPRIYFCGSATSLIVFKLDSF